MKFLFFLSLILISACSNKSTKNPNDFLNFYTGQPLNLNLQSFNEDNITYMSSSYLVNFRESLNIRVSGQFNLHKNGQLDLFSYSDPNQINGNILRLKPSEEEPETLEVILFSEEINALQICSIPYALSRTNKFDLTIQLDNSAENTRVSIWNEFQSEKSSRRINQVVYNLKTTICTTQDQVSLNSLGFGTRWGFTPKQMKLQEIKRQSPYAL